jgi:hypothetical protein
MTPNTILLELLQAEASRMLIAYPEQIKSGRMTQEYANEAYMAIETAIQYSGGPAPHPSHIMPGGVVVRELTGLYNRLKTSAADAERLEPLQTLIELLQV